VVVAAGQPGLDKEGAELGPVEVEPGGFLGDLGTSNVDGRRVFEELFLDAVAVEAGDHDQLEGNGGRGETSRFEVAGIELNVGAADVS
jgi:hypothetical protein